MKSLKCLKEFIIRFEKEKWTFTLNFISIFWDQRFYFVGIGSMNLTNWIADLLFHEQFVIFHYFRFRLCPENFHWQYTELKIIVNFSKVYYVKFYKSRPWTIHTSILSWIQTHCNQQKWVVSYHDEWASSCCV